MLVAVVKEGKGYNHIVTDISVGKAAFRDDLRVSGYTVLKVYNEKELEALKKNGVQKGTIQEKYMYNLLKRGFKF